MTNIEQSPLARLREAREARGLTLEELAEQIGSSRQFVFRHEQGVRRPHTSTIESFCAALHVLPSFFAREPARQHLTPVFFRQFRSKTVPRDRLKAERQLSWVQDVVRHIEKYVVLPPINVPDISPPSDPREISNDDIEKAAQSVRRSWGLGDGVLPNVIGLLESHGCIVVRDLVDGQDCIDGFSQWEMLGRPFVVVDCRGLSPAHRRSDAAHELGHIVLHKNVDKRFLNLNPHTHKLIEEQAFRFGAAFLLPATTFKGAVQTVALDTLLWLKPKLKASVALMLSRAIQLQMVLPEQSKRLWINLNRRGWKAHEPFEDRIALEEPLLLRNAILRMRDSVPGSVSLLCTETGLYPSDVARYCNTEENDIGVESPTFTVTVREDSGLQALR